MKDAKTTFQERYVEAGARLTPSEKKIGEYLLRNPDEVLGSSAVKIAEATGTSGASVIRTIKGLGYQGLPELKKELLESVLRRRHSAATLDHNIESIQTNKRPAEQMLANSVDIIDAFRERSEEHTSELQSRGHLVCRLLLEKKKGTTRSELHRGHTPSRV